MIREMIALSIAVVSTMTALGQEKPKFDKNAIIAVWEQKRDGKVRTIEFTKDGRFLTALIDKSADLSAVGSYGWNGDKLEVILEVGGQKKSDKLTVEKLTDGVLVLINGAGDRSEFRRVQP